MLKHALAVPVGWASPSPSLLHVTDSGLYFGSLTSGHQAIFLTVIEV